MVFIFGSRLYGKTDEVPGLFHVATTFGHLWYIPLIPTGSYLLLEETGFSQGIKIPLSLKSILLGWLRPGTLITAVVAGIVALSESRSPKAAVICAAALAAFLILKFSRHLRFATYERACALGEVSGINERGKTLIDLHFGKVSEAEARKKFLDAEARDLDEAERVIAARKAELQARQLEGMTQFPNP